MTDGAAVDTDVLLKTAAYRLSGEVVAALVPFGQPAALGLTHLIAARQLARKRSYRDVAGAAAELAALLPMLGRLEPDEEEVELAADLATTAQTRGLPLDAGEAQLLAIVAMRGLPLLVTGDKRALAAISALLTDEPARSALVGRFACLEQVLATVSAMIGSDGLRARICAEPDADGSMRLACSCGRQDWDQSELDVALESFVGDVRRKTGDLLIAGSMLA